MLQNESTLAQVQSVQEEYDEGVQCEGLEHMPTIRHRPSVVADNIRKVFMEYFAIAVAK